ncbi:MAG: DUF2269 family protein [Chloroflexota bacterium]
MNTYLIWLYLHIMGAIIAFGFGFTVPVIGRMVAAEPMHGNWWLRASERVGRTIIIPTALSMIVTGGLLVMTSGHSFKELWLGVALVLYIIALVLSIFVQRPAVLKAIELTSTPPGPGGPNPEVPKLLARARGIGMLLGLLVVIIVFLMVFKPF